MLLHGWWRSLALSTWVGYPREEGVEKEGKVARKGERDAIGQGPINARISFPLVWADYETTLVWNLYFILQNHFPNTIWYFLILGLKNTRVLGSTLVFLGMKTGSRYLTKFYYKNPLKKKKEKNTIRVDRY